MTEIERVLRAAQVIEGWPGGRGVAEEVRAACRRAAANKVTCRRERLTVAERALLPGEERLARLAMDAGAWLTPVSDYLLGRGPVPIEHGERPRDPEPVRGWPTVYVWARGESAAGPVWVLVERDAPSGG